MAFFQTANLWVNQLADAVAELVIAVADRKVNVLTSQIFGELDQALDRVTAAEKFHVLLVRSGKPDHFCAGADIQEMRDRATPEQASAFAEQGQRLFSRIAAFPLPTLAVIAGSCLGGGLELALACDARVVVGKPSTELGFPEIELGLTPAWGGTQRLPRLVGLERALYLILGTRRIGPHEALAWGLADELATPDDEEPPAFLAHPRKCPRPWLPYRTWRQRIFESTRLGRWLIFRGARRLLKRRLPDDMPGPWEALEAARVGLRQGFDAGLADERDA